MNLSLLEVADSQKTLSPPCKEIFTPQDMSKWLESEAYQVQICLVSIQTHYNTVFIFFGIIPQEYNGFILAINESVKGKKIPHQKPCDDKIVKILHLLDRLDQWIDEIPPTDQPQRFGNQSFRLWYQKLKDVSLKIFVES